MNIMDKNINVIVHGPSDVAKLMYKVYGQVEKLDKFKEHLYLIGLSCRLKIRHVELISLGTLDENLISQREIFKTAIMRNDHAIVLVHNHPSGDVTPSDEDIKVTQIIVGAGNIMGIKLYDHIIIGFNDFYSMATHQVVNFGSKEIK